MQYVIALAMSCCSIAQVRPFTLTLQAEFDPNTRTIRVLGGEAVLPKDVPTSQPTTQPATRPVWATPIGVPAPSFGIAEKHTMYAGQQYDFGSGPAPYPDAGSGPYTHYVDNTHASATNTNNPYGSPSKPRLTFHNTAFPAGSVVEVHGGPYTRTDNTVILIGSGTLDKPVFIRGVGSPTVACSARLGGSCLIVEGFNLRSARITYAATAKADHVCLRNSEIAGGGSGTTGVQIVGYTQDQLTGVVLYNNRIHDFGDIASTVDEDFGGVFVGSRVDHCWILENEIFNTSGSGVQILAGSVPLLPYTNHIYVGRNTVHHVRQSGIWSKQSSDCVFSQNTVHDVINTSWSPSKGLGYQYGPERLWIIYNHVYDCVFGIAGFSTSYSGGGTGQEVYIIGNVIHAIHCSPGNPQNYPLPTSAWSNAAIGLMGIPHRYILNNTIYDVDAGINSAGAGEMFMANNVISQVTEPKGHHVWIEVDAASATLDNCVLYQNGEACRIRWGMTLYDLPSFQAQVGKGNNCVKGDPLFVDPGAYDFRVSAGSPCINSGIAAQAYNRFMELYGLDIQVDPAGVPRPQGAGWDIGAHER